MNQGQPIKALQIDDLLLGRLTLVLPIHRQDHVHGYLLVVTSLRSLTKVHEVRDVTIMPSRYAVGYSAAWHRTKRRCPAIVRGPRGVPQPMGPAVGV